MDSDSREAMIEDDYLFGENIVGLSTLFSNIASALATAIGIPCNLLVLYSILYIKDMRTVTHIYIFNLALADLFFLMGTPILITQMVKREWIFGSALCKLFLATSGVNQFASSTFIALLSFDRYLAVCHVVKSTRWRTRTIALILVFTAWIVVFTEMIPIFVYSTVVERPFEEENRNKSSCTLFWSDTEFLNDTEKESVVYSRRRLFSIYSVTLSYIIPLTGIWFFYGNIIVKVWLRRTKFLSPHRQRIRRTTLKVTVMGLAIVISYTALYFPFWFSQWLIEAGVGFYQDQSLRMIIAYVSYSLLYINSALNPFLCVIFTDTFIQKTMRRQTRNTLNQRSMIENGDYCSVPLSNMNRQSSNHVKYNPKSPYI